MTMLPDPPAISPSGPAPAGQRPPAALGQITGDRPCTGCGFNLVGQPITREPHYGLLLARCPECGCAAALQEYPLLGRWAARWGAVLATLWFLMIIGLAALSGEALRSTASSVNETTLRPLARFVAEKHRDHQLGKIVNNANGQRNWYADQAVNEQTYIELAWWEDQMPETLLAEANAAGKLRDWRVLSYFWRSYSLGLALLGVVWSGVLVTLPVRRMWIAALALGAWGVVLVVLARESGNIPATPGAYFTATQLSARLLDSWLDTTVLAVGLAPVWVGMVLGRRVLRGAIGLLLPPRMRASFSILWTCDGLPPPRSVNVRT